MDNAVKTLSRTLDLYSPHRRRDRRRRRGTVTQILRDLPGEREDQAALYGQVKQVTANPFHLKVVKVRSEQRSTDMALRLLHALESLAPGQPLPSGPHMADLLGLHPGHNRDTFLRGYAAAVQRLEAVAAPAPVKRINLLYWLCLSLFGTLAFFVVLAQGLHLVREALFGFHTDSRLLWVAEWLGYKPFNAFWPHSWFN